MGKLESTDPILMRAAIDDISRQSFFHFLWRCFETLHQGQNNEFVPAWHIRAMCYELGELQAGRNKRLVINVPPRCLKSITTAVALPAFLMGQDPSSKIIVASYGLDLGRKHSEDCRKIMESAWYRRVFPGTRLAARGNTQEEIRTTKGGARKAVSIGSSVTGHGADVLIIDDLLKAGDATSEAELVRAQEFIEGTLLSRFDNPAEGRVVLVGQRLHERDPAGYLLDKGTYRHLNLPAIAEDRQAVAIGPGKSHIREARTALFPERLGLETLGRMRQEMGAAVFNCQYQQNPISPDGSPLKWEWFGSYDDPQERSSFQLIVQSWDTGTSADPRSDFSVGTTWGFKDRKWYLLDLYRAQLDYPDLKVKVLDHAQRWQADRVLIEDAETGRALLQECRMISRAKFFGEKPTVSKEIRFRAACSLVEEGKVLLPREAAWLATFKREMQSFPRGRNDDQVDSFSQFADWAKGNGFYRALGYEHQINKERRAQKERQRVRR